MEEIIKYDSVVTEFDVLEEQANRTIELTYALENMASYIRRTDPSFSNSFPIPEMSNLKRFVTHRLLGSYNLDSKVLTLIQKLKLLPNFSDTEYSSSFVKVTHIEGDDRKSSSFFNLPNSFKLDEKTVEALSDLVPRYTTKITWNRGNTKTEMVDNYLIYDHGIILVIGDGALAVWVLKEDVFCKLPDPVYLNRFYIEKLIDERLLHGVTFRHLFKKEAEQTLEKFLKDYAPSLALIQNLLFQPKNIFEAIEYLLNTSFKQETIYEDNARMLQCFDLVTNFRAEGYRVLDKVKEYLSLVAKVTSMLYGHSKYLSENNLTTIRLIGANAGDYCGKMVIVEVAGESLNANVWLIPKLDSYDESIINALKDSVPKIDIVNYKPANLAELFATAAPLMDLVSKARPVTKSIQ